MAGMSQWLDLTGEGGDSSDEDEQVVRKASLSTSRFDEEEEQVHLEDCVVLPEPDVEQYLKKGLKYKGIEGITPSDFLAGTEGRMMSCAVIAWACYHGVPQDRVLRHLDSFGRKEFDKALTSKQNVGAGWFAFYIIRVNYVKVLAKFCQYSTSFLDNSFEPDFSKKTDSPYWGLDPLSFGIVAAHKTGFDATHNLKCLLMHGISAHMIHKKFWIRPLVPLDVFSSSHSNSNEQDVDGERPAKRSKLSSITAKYKNAAVESTDELQNAQKEMVVCALTLEIRYMLWKAAELQSSITPLKTQMAGLFGLQKMWSLSLHIVGQFFATKKLESILFARDLCAEHKPLVLMLYGVSGHGKSESTVALSKSLDCEAFTQDMTEVTVERELFGPKEPWRGADRGFPLNNFLARNSGRTSLVTLDEFEKTNREVQNSLLNLFDKGTYRNRKNGESIDCSRVIWLLTSNFGTEEILEFFERSKHDRYKDWTGRHTKETLGPLLKRVEDTATSRFGAPVAGRVTAWIPYVPFTILEQSAFAAQVLRKWARLARSMPNQSEIHMSKTKISFLNEDHIIKKITDMYYSPERGARSIYTKVFEDLKTAHCRMWLAEKGDDKTKLWGENMTKKVTQVQVDSMASEGQEVFVMRRAG